MTRLRKMMLDELERRNYSQNTRRLYLHGVSECAQYFHCSLDQLGLDHIRDYQARLFTGSVQLTLGRKQTPILPDMNRLVRAFARQPRRCCDYADGMRRVSSMG